ncbi:heme-binding protein [Streptomyces malaysiensis]|uniref:Uncharacterized protein n=1 Tax=Streptomyces malaysiensis TaxID=92644 RepID=A0A481S7Z1_STRMQ|nr:hypothetical protein [Streptomyces malaysiensis]QBG82447.1 hypothetical protein SMALB_0223 [Streptomyces malaysiensis]
MLLPLAFARMDGTPFPPAEVAIGKAYTAAAFVHPSAEVAEPCAGWVQFTTSISMATGGQLRGSGGSPRYAAAGGGPCPTA